MKRSLVVFADDPTTVVTTTSTCPVPLGIVTVIDVAVSVVMAAELVPNLTDVALSRLEPEITMVLPLDPEVGLMPVTVGGVP